MAENPFIDFVAWTKRERQKSMGSRWQWLTELIRTWDLKVGAEIGIQLGRTTLFLLTQCPELRLYAIDPWDTPGNSYIERYDWDMGKMREHFIAELEKLNVMDRVTVMKAFSQDAVKQIEDESLDFVFLDGDHDYKPVMEDIAAWSKKVRLGGFITGHDTHFPGVRRALDETFGEGVWHDALVDYCWYVRKD